MSTPALSGKVGLVVGVANKRSLAWAIAQAAAREGAAEETDLAVEVAIVTLEDGVTVATVASRTGATIEGAFRVTLPADVQRELPKLAISGGVYSQNVAQRMLIVGGQVVAQGAQLAPGVVLDEIRPHSAVLRFRGYKYGVVY